MYATGQGVAKDETKAKKWWTASAAQGNETATCTCIENLKKLEKEMKNNMTKNATKNNKINKIQY
jgi:TPR repeat protein